MIKKLVYILGFILTIVTIILTLYVSGLINILELNTQEYIVDNIVNQNSLKETFAIIFKNSNEIEFNKEKTLEIIEIGTINLIKPIDIATWCMLILAIINVFALIKLWVYIYLYRDYIPLYLQQGGRVVDKKGIYGTANWLTDEKLKKYLKKKYIALSDGIPFGTIDSNTNKSISKIRKNLVTSPVNPRFNDNCIVFAPPGEGKTFSFVFTTVMNLLYSRYDYLPSFILNDSKGDVYHKLAKYLREVHDYTTFVFNIISTENSDRINFLDWIDEEADALILVDLILKNTSNGIEDKSGDDFWEQGEEAIFVAVLLYFKFETDTYVNMGIVYDFFSNNTWEEIDGLMSKIPLNRPAGRIFNTFKNKIDPTIRGNMIFGLTIRLKIFALDQYRALTEYTDIDIYKLKTEQTALFYCIPDTNKTMNYLVSLVKTMIAVKMVKYIDASNDKVVKERKIVQIDDEIANTGIVPQYPEWINSFRSRKWILIPIYQNIKQMEEMFGETWEMVYEACHTKIYIGINGPLTAQAVSKELGEQSIRVMTKFKDSGITNMFEDERWSQTDQKRNLMNPDELTRLDIDRQIVIRRGCDPMLLYKVPWSSFKKEYKKALSMPESVFQYTNDSRNEKKIPRLNGNQVLDFSKQNNFEKDIPKKNDVDDSLYDLSDLEDGFF